jgi:hypothetical protein
MLNQTARSHGHSALNASERSRTSTAGTSPSPEQLYCDTTLVHDHLAVAVLSERPSDKRFDILENVEPSWKEKEEFCLRCGDERNIGWCDTCRGRRCRSCGSCGCNPPVENPLCPNCFLHNPFRPGATICRDCELELG